MQQNIRTHSIALHNRNYKRLQASSMTIHRQHFFLCAAAGIAIFLSSCTTTLYKSNTVNTPLFHEEKEVRISAGPGNVQTAYAITDHVGIMGNAFWESYNKDNKDNSGTLVEVGAGYFTPVLPDLIFEAYGGIGLGKISFDETLNAGQNNARTRNYEVNGMRWFVQPSIGYNTPYFEAAFTPRFSFVSFSNYSASGYTPQEIEQEHLNQNTIENTMWMFVEPAITLRGGYKWIKLQAQYGVTLKTNADDLNHGKDFFNISLIADIGTWFEQR